MISYFIQNVVRKKQSLHNDIRKLDPSENVQSIDKEFFPKWFMNLLN